MAKDTKKYRQQTVGTPCGCGAPSTSYSSSTWSCDRCRRLDGINDEFHRRLAGQRMAWLLKCIREVDDALDRYWERRGLPEPEARQFNPYW